MPSSCKEIRAALASCLQASPCVLIERNTPAECMRHPLCDSLPVRCQQLKRGYTECRRGMVDMRKRFRGNQPIGVSQDLESHVGRGQLYAGGGTLWDVKKKKQQQQQQQNQEQQQQQHQEQQQQQHQEQQLQQHQEQQLQQHQEQRLRNAGSAEDQNNSEGG